MKVIAVSLLSLCLSACYFGGAFTPSDSAPVRSIDPSTISNPVPRVEPITRAGNKNPYSVFGKTYHLLPSSEGYRERGIASWYGTKFHGRNTANGERYDLYSMTAAHKTLPIPAYVIVRNLENGKEIIVRVNDRGPFHDDRIIDLSYAAAVKLGFSKKGTALVEVEAINPKTWGKPPAPVMAAGKTPAPSVKASSVVDPNDYFVQVGAFKSLVSAQNLRSQIMSITSHPVKVNAAQMSGDFYRVRIGPVILEQVQPLMSLLQQNNLGAGKILTQPRK